MHDILTVVVILVVLGMIGFTIYSYVKNSQYSHYALAVSIAGVLSLILITRTTGLEKELDMSLGSTSSPGDPRRSLRWGKESKIDLGLGSGRKKRKHK
jgi:uncharacterized membrane protein